MNIIIEHTPCVTMIPGNNPGPMTHQGTNTYLIGTGNKRILIDSGQGIHEYHEILKQFITDKKITIDYLLITHYHQDHTRGIRDIRQLSPQVKIFKSLDQNIKEDIELQDEFQFKYENIYDGQIFQIDNFTIRAIKSPGHSVDHFSFYFMEEKSLFCGDCLLGGSSTIIDNLKQYIESMSRLNQLELDVIYTGHGFHFVGSQNCHDALQQQIKHRLAREKQILGVLQQNNQSTIDLIFEQIYPDIKNQILVQSAKKNIQVHLRKLIDEKVVNQIGNDQYSLLKINL